MTSDKAKEAIEVLEVAEAEVEWRYVKLAEDGE